jgi:tetratricopeptide (TPR) repeat protein
MEGAKRPGGSSGILPTLAARLSYQGKRTENAIIFLQEIIKKTEDKNLRWVYERRLAALKEILLLEKAVAIYKERFKREPIQLAELAAKNIIKEIPKDPYGGEFYIDKDGSIKTTSELR